LLSLWFLFQKSLRKDGRQLFNNNCASCHSLTKDMTGPKLGGVLDKEPYSGDVKKSSSLGHNADKLTNTDPYYKGLKAQFGTQMTCFSCPA
jgi:cytochrome c2